MSDKEMEKEIVSLGLTAPRVTLESIEALMASVVYDVHVIPDTNTTLATAILDGFTLATEQTSCVDKANFNAELGAKYAIEAAKASAKSKLWELEGYALKKQLAIESTPLSRLLAEEKELSIKNDKLCLFLEGERPVFISENDWASMHEQELLQSRLIEILAMRIGNFKE